MEVKIFGRAKTFLLGMLCSLLVLSGAAFAANKFTLAQVRTALSNASEYCYQQYDQFEHKASCNDGAAAVYQYLRN